MRTGVPPDDRASTQRLLRAARMLDGTRAPSSGEPRPSSEGDFVRAYRDWINAHNAISGPPGERIERIRMLMLTMLTASDLAGALEIMARFGTIALGHRSAIAIEDTGGVVSLQIDRPFEKGLVGLIAELWPLSLHLSQIEFLVGRPLPRATGRIRNSLLLSPDIAGLLFERPLEEGAAVLALSIPKPYLSLALVAKPADAATFMPRLLPSGYAEADAAVDVAALVESLLRSDRLRGSSTPSSVDGVSGRLGCSPATLRRRLAQEGTTFRDVRAAAFDGLAKHWLGDPRLTCGMIAERLGYTDGFSFGRSFARLNGCSPTAYRRSIGRPPRAGCR